MRFLKHLIPTVLLFGLSVPVLLNIHVPAGLAGR